MDVLTSRHVKPEEAVRLGVKSGWYSIKVSGTFVSGPHLTNEDSQRSIEERARLNAG